MKMVSKGFLLTFEESIVEERTEWFRNVMSNKAELMAVHNYIIKLSEIDSVIVNQWFDFSVVEKL